MLNGFAGVLDTTDFQNYMPFSADGIGIWDSGDQMILEDNVPVRNATGGLEEPDDPVIWLARAA